MRLVALSTALLATFSAAGSPTWGQEPAGNYEHLKPLEWLTGDWVGEYTATFDLGPVKKGDHVTSYASQRRILNNSFLVQDFSIEVGGKRTPDTHEIIGWDPGGKKLVHWIYSPLGSGSGVWSEVGEKAVLRWSADITEGKLQGTSVLQRIDEDTYTWQATGVTLVDKKLLDWPKVTYRRATGVAAGDLWTAYRDAVVGTWLGTGTLGRDFPDHGLAKGDRFTYRLTSELDLDGAVMLGEGDFRVAAKDYATQVRVITSWDPAARQVRLIACWSDGGVEDALIQRRTKSGFSGIYVPKFVGAETGRMRFRMDFANADSYVITFVDGPRKGEVLSSWKRQ